MKDEDTADMTDEALPGTEAPAERKVNPGWANLGPGGNAGVVAARAARLTPKVSAQKAMEARNTEVQTLVDGYLDGVPGGLQNDALFRSAVRSLAEAQLSLADMHLHAAGAKKLDIRLLELIGKQQDRLAAQTLDILGRLRAFTPPSDNTGICVRCREETAPSATTVALIRRRTAARLARQTVPEIRAQIAATQARLDARPAASPPPPTTTPTPPRWWRSPSPSATAGSVTTDDSNATPPNHNSGGGVSNSEATPSEISNGPVAPADNNFSTDKPESPGVAADDTDSRLTKLEAARRDELRARVLGEVIAGAAAGTPSPVADETPASPLERLNSILGKF